MKGKEVIIQFIAFSFVALFVYTAVSKWIDINAFVQQMDAQPFNNRWTPLLVWALPSVELLAAGLLLLPKTRPTGLCLSLLLMLIFTVYIKLVTTGYYGYIPCACGGIIRKFNWWQHFWFNIYFVLLGIIGVVLSFYDRRKANSKFHAGAVYN